MSYPPSPVSQDDELDRIYRDLLRVAVGAKQRGEWQTAAEILDLAVRAKRERGGLLTTSHRGKKKAVEAVERLQVSKGKAGEEPDPLHSSANAAGFTLRSLCKQLKSEGWRCSHQYLMQCRRGDANIRLSLAKRIQALTGFAATRSNWPGNAWAKEPDEG